jgi:hypothetical protein
MTRDAKENLVAMVLKFIVISPLVSFVIKVCFLAKASIWIRSKETTPMVGQIKSLR